MKPTPTVSLPDLYANWMATGASMLLGEFPSSQAKKAAPIVAPRKKVRRAAPAKKRSPARKAKAKGARRK